MRRLAMTLFAMVGPPVSVHVVWRIFAEHVRGGDEHMPRDGARRQRVTGEQAHGERQHIIAVAIHVVGDRTEHHAAPVVGVELLLLAGGAVDVAVEPLAYNDAVALPPVRLDGSLPVYGGQIIE